MNKNKTVCLFIFEAVKSFLAGIKEFLLGAFTPLIHNTFKGVVLRYNGKKYLLQEGDLPGLDSDSRGLIRIISRPGYQYSNTDVNFCANTTQINNSTYLNGEKIEDIIKRVETRKK